MKHVPISHMSFDIKSDRHFFHYARLISLFTFPDCSVCWDNYSSSVGLTCVECSGNTEGIVLATVLAVVVPFIVVAVVLYLVSGNTDATGQGMVGRLQRVVPLQSIKIIIVAWQILTQVKETSTRWSSNSACC